MIVYVESDSGNWFNSNFELFIEGVQKGAITFSTWKSDAEATLENESYFFKITFVIVGINSISALCTTNSASVGDRIELKSYVLVENSFTIY